MLLLRSLDDIRDCAIMVQGAVLAGGCIASDKAGWWVADLGVVFSTLFCEQLINPFGYLPPSLRQHQYTYILFLETAADISHIRLSDVRLVLAHW